ncbi:MAG: FAD-dependent oxidoreductase [Candidatus Cloacimonetes bacterium]|nr:FAD-dependent oxidoreductase [Candidatus Cloacimonadota bacterium]
MSDKIGIYVCECGPNISSKVDIERILEEIAALEDFRDKELIVKQHKLLCSVAGKAFLEEEIKANELTHLICAACSPRDHDSTFKEVCKKAGLNPYMYKIVNIREQCAWVISDKEKATDKAIQYIHAGMDRVVYQQPLIEKQLDSNPDVLVIGGGIAGLQSALTLAGKNRRVFLVEKSAELGGTSIHFQKLLPRQGSDTATRNRKIKEVNKNPYIKVFTSTELSKIVGFLGNFEIVLKNSENDSETELLAGAVVLANGFQQANPQDFEGYNYTDNDEVYSALEIEKMYSETNQITMKSGELPKTVALVHCVGRKEVGYCSKICCNYLIKISDYLQSISSDIEIIDLFQDMCLPEKEDQEYYEELAARVIHSQRVTGTKVAGNKLTYTGINGRETTIEPDMIILAPAIIPAADNVHFANLLNIELHETGFFQEAHIKINPVSTNTDGVFVVGANRGACSISDAVIQAQAAAGKVLTQLIPGQKIIPEVMVSEILEAYCTGCQTCLEVCAYGAIYYDAERGISVVNEAICRGCGNCVGSCPSGSIRTRHFTNPQLYQEVKEALRK